MALTKSSVFRTNPVSGDSFIILNDGGSLKAQGVGLIGDDGLHAGIAGNPAIVQADSKTWYSSGATKENQKNLKASAGVLWSVSCTIDPADNPSTTRWLMVFDKASAPVDTDVPVFRVPVAGGGNAVVDFPRGLSLATGVSVALSTTVDDLTLPTAENFFDSEYE